MLAFSVLLLTTVVATGATFIIADSWRRHGKAALALRSALLECDDWQELRFTITEIEVGTGGAKILRPDFGLRPLRPAAQAGLRAAA